MLSPPREDHDEDHRSSSSAVQIQSWWRALKARNLLRSIFDRDPGSLTGLKALFFLRHDDTRLKIWSTIIKERGGLPQCHPDQKSSWIILVKPIARRICKNVTSRPLSLQTMPHLEVLHTLLVPSAASEDQITKKDRQGVIMYLMRHGGYNELYKVMVSIPPKKDHDFQVPLLTLLVPLLTSHFHILSTTPSSRPYLTCLQDIFTQLLTVPVLANRFTGALELLTTFSADLGFVLNEMHKLSQSLPEIISGMTLDSKVHLLANLMVFTPVRYTAMPLKSFDVYLRLLALLIHDVPEAFLRAPVTEDSWIVNVQHADVARDIDPITQKHLFILLSLGHTSQILESRSNPEISASSIDCLTNLYFYWAVKREKVLRAIVSAQAWDIASFLYRARVRENPLGKVEAARIADVEYASHWPAVVFLADLYTRWNLTVPEEAFFSSDTRFQNPLDSTELQEFIRQLTYIVYALDQKSIQPIPLSRVAMLRWENARKKLADCLHTLYTRHSRRHIYLQKSEPVQVQQGRERKIIEGEDDFYSSERLEEIPSPNEPNSEATIRVPESINELRKRIKTSTQTIYPHQLGDFYLGCLEKIMEQRSSRQFFAVIYAQTISCYEEALDMAWPDYSGKSDILEKLVFLRLTYWCNSGCDIEDMKRAISHLEELVGNNPSSAQLFKAGIQFLKNFHEVDEITHLADMIPGLAGFTSSLLVASDSGTHSYNSQELSEQLVQLGDKTVIQKAISAVVHVLELQQPIDVELDCIANWFYGRFQLHRVLSDLNKAIDIQRPIVRGHMARPSFGLLPSANTFAKWLELRHHETGEEANLKELHALLSWLLTAGGWVANVNPLGMLQACVRFLRLPKPSNYAWDPTPYTVAIRSLRDIGYMGLVTQLRETVVRVTETGSLVGDAVARALEARDFENALEWLENGRNVIWNALLSIQDTSGDILVDENDRGSGKDVVSFRAIETHEQRKLRLREMDGITILKQPYGGPVILLNASEFRCDAIILGLSRTLLQHVPLESLSYAQVCSWQQRWRELIGRMGAIETDDHFQTLLGEIWNLLITPILEVILNDTSATPKQGLPRVWWCPTGPFTSLPIHVAGLYPSDPNSVVCLSDFVISSFTSSISSLVSASEDMRNIPFKLLLVTQPSTPNESPLPGVVEEAAAVRMHTQSSSTVTLNGAEATRAAVIKEAETCSWIHLACHGIQDGRISRFLLHDGTLSVHKLSELAAIARSQLEFAFLSACQTAMGEEHSQDEALHLAGGLQVVGCRSIIATLFSIGDSDAPFVADRVYEHLFRDNQPDYTEAAEALHSAVEALRKRYDNRSFRSWVPYIHMGA